MKILGGLRENTKLVWVKSVTNLMLGAVNVPRISVIIEKERKEGRSRERLVMLVDSTFHVSLLSQGMARRSMSVSTATW